MVVRGCYDALLAPRTGINFQARKGQEGIVMLLIKWALMVGVARMTGRPVVIRKDKVGVYTVYADGGVDFEYSSPTGEEGGDHYRPRSLGDMIALLRRNKTLYIWGLSHMYGL
jgi:hypothetical protein